MYSGKTFKIFLEITSFCMEYQNINWPLKKKKKSDFLPLKGAPTSGQRCASPHFLYFTNREILYSVYTLNFIVFRKFSLWAQPQHFPNVQIICHWQQHYDEKLYHPYPGLIGQHIKKDSVLFTHLWLKCVYSLFFSFLFSLQ